MQIKRYDRGLTGDRTTGKLFCLLIFKRSPRILKPRRKWVYTFASLRWTVWQLALFQAADITF